MCTEEPVVVVENKKKGAKKRTAWRNEHVNTKIGEKNKSFEEILTQTKNTKDRRDKELELEE